MNQTRDPAEAVNCDDGSHLDRRDLQPEMFYCVYREHVEFDESDDYQKCAEKFKKACKYSKAISRIYFLVLFCAVSFLTLRKAIKSVKTG